jgi:Family of unknown function (DUF5330)
MWFLIRVAFWLSIVIMLLPTDRSHVATPGPQVGAGDALSAAGAAVSDMRSFCSRQPEACAVGSQAATVFGQKAQASAKLIYDYLSDKAGSEESVTGTAAKSAATVGRPAERPSQNTLTPADRAPAWRGPQPRQEVAKRPA